LAAGLMSAAYSETESTNPASALASLATSIRQTFIGPS
jgi:hypothetical protein